MFKEHTPNEGTSTQESLWKFVGKAHVCGIWAVVASLSRAQWSGDFPLGSSCQSTGLPSPRF